MVETLRACASRAESALLPTAPPAELLSIEPVLRARLEDLASRDVDTEPTEDALPALPHGFSAMLSAITAHVVHSSSAFDLELQRIDDSVAKGAASPAAHS